jgi:hypothetical protein
MNDVEQKAKGDDALVVRRVMVCSGILLLLLTVGSWWFFGRSLAQSILVGGLLVNGSFCLLKKDAQRLMQRVGEEDAPSAMVNMEKTRFFLRSLARFVVLGLLLFVLASQVAINVVGLTLGFGTVMVSVVIIGLGTGKCCLPSKV